MATTLVSSLYGVNGAAQVGVLAYNHFDNPNFEVNQFYGNALDLAVTTTASVHVIDRWRGACNSGTYNQEFMWSTGVPTGSASKHCLVVVNNNIAQASGTLIQRWSSDQVRKFRTGPCTISFWFYASTITNAVTINLKTPSADTDFTSVTTRNEGGSGWTSSTMTASSWNKVTYTFDPSAWTNIDKGLEFNVVFTAPASGSCRLADFMLNQGSTAATFVAPTLAESEARCFPFYQKTFDRSVAVAQNSTSDLGVLYAIAGSTTPSSLGVRWFFNPPMRVAPVVTRYTISAASSNWSNTGYADSTILSQTGWNGISDHSVLINGNTGGGSPTAGTVYLIHASADARL